MTAPLPARLLVVLGAALALAGVVSGAYGPRPLSTYEYTVDPQGAAGVAFLFFSISSNGHLNATIEGVDSVFYVANLSGDPVTVLRALEVFNIRMGESNLEHDVRAGLIHGYATIEAQQRILRALPTLAALLNFNIETAQVENGTATITAKLRAASGIVIVATPSEGEVRVHAAYRLEGYDRLPPDTAALLGAAMVAGGALLDLAARRGIRPPANHGPTRGMSRRRSTNPADGGG